MNAFKTSAFVISMVLVTLSARAAEPNTLTVKEKRQGWILLFDGTTMNGWRGAYRDSLPTQGWTVRDGQLIVQESGGRCVSLPRMAWKKFCMCSVDMSPPPPNCVPPSFPTDWFRLSSLPLRS